MRAASSASVNAADRVPSPFNTAPLKGRAGSVLLATTPATAAATMPGTPSPMALPTKTTRSQFSARAAAHSADAVPDCSTTATRYFVCSVPDSTASRRALWTAALWESQTIQPMSGSSIKAAKAAS